MNAFKKERFLGQIKSTRHYDIPLTKSVDTRFIITLIALMSFMAVTMLSGSFALSSISDRWSSGLEDKLTIEIPAEDNDEKIRTPETIKALSDTIAEKLSNTPNIQSFEVMSQSEIQDLISPWLGNDTVLDNIPMPGLISVSLDHTKQQSKQTTLKHLQKTLTNIDDNIVLDTHEAWLSDILKITTTLNWTAILIVMLITATTVIAVAGSIRTRMAIHKADVELLHLMGARDNYIMRQFQRHALILAFKGSTIGVAFAFIALGLIILFAGEATSILMPEFSIEFKHIVLIFLVPVFTCLIAAIAARFTVLRVLSMMP